MTEFPKLITVQPFGSDFAILAQNAELTESMRQNEERFFAVYELKTVLRAKCEATVTEVQDVKGNARK